MLSPLVAGRHAQSAQRLVVLVLVLALVVVVVLLVVVVLGLRGGSGSGFFVDRARLVRIGLVLLVLAALAMMELDV